MLPLTSFASPSEDLPPPLLKPENGKLWKVQVSFNVGSETVPRNCRVHGGGLLQHARGGGGYKFMKVVQHLLTIELFSSGLCSSTPVVSFFL